MVYGRFAAYVNIPTEQVTLHRPPCLQMGKRVGVRRTDNGYYRENYRNAESVKRLAYRLRYELVVCSFCLKGFDQVGTPADPPYKHYVKCVAK